MASSPQPRRTRKDSHSILKKGALALASLGAGLVLVELGLHAVGYWPSITWDWQLGTTGRVLNSDVILIRPDFLEEAFYEATETATRIVALGDSFTEGYPVSGDNSYPAVLERVLRKQGRDVSVLNMGLGNSGPDIQLRLLQGYALPRFEPDFLIWTFYSNDLTDNLSQPGFETRGGKLVPLDGTDHWTYRRYHLYDNIPLPDGLKNKSAIVRVFLKAWEASQLSRLDLGPEAQAASRARVPLTLGEARRLSAKHKFKLLVVLIAPQAAYLSELEPEKWSNHQGLQQYLDLRRILEEDGPLLEIFHTDVLEAAQQGELESAAPGFGIFVDATRDGGTLGRHHFNEEGYRRTARTIAAQIDAHLETAARPTAATPVEPPPNRDR